MTFSLLLGIGLVVLLFPLCVGRTEVKQELFERIEVDHKLRLHQAFTSQKEQIPLPGVKWLAARPRLVNNLAELMGIEQKKILMCLERLRWHVTLVDIVWFKLVAGFFLLGVLLVVLYSFLLGDGLTTGTILLLVVSLVLFLLPTFIVERADQRAKAEIEQQIPVFFSLVQALVEAGMPIFQAIQAAAKHDRGRLGREFMLLQWDEKRYGNWRKALEEMAFRWDIDALVSIISDINDALTKGTSIAQLIAEHVEEQLKLQEDAAADHMNRLSIRLLPLIILFMGVPLMFLVMGPSFIGIHQQL